jgi:hypothetical protein
MQDYQAFLERKAQLGGDHGFDPVWMPDFLFPFQDSLVEWATRKGRAALLVDCGLGKTPMQLVWAENVVRKTDKPVLVLTPLAVAQQTLREAEKFGIGAARSHAGEMPAERIVIANYERLHHFDPTDFGGVVCDESSILKNFDGVRRGEITEFMRRLPYRLLATATAAPNDYHELGTSSEALGELGYMDVLGRFFITVQGSNYNYRGKYRIAECNGWRFRGHAEQPFWRWVSSWARAMRHPSDLGFSDDGFALPPLTHQEHMVAARKPRPGMLFDVPANGFHEEREERRRTVTERCEMAAALVNETGQAAVVWCHLNDEGDLLERLIPDGVQVSGRDNDDAKEARFLAFQRGDTRVLITKPKIGAWGLNWQHCAHIVTFPSHSYEQMYQAVRRCWRFGQEREVVVDVVLTEGEVGIQENVQRKAEQAERMFTALTEHMKDALAMERQVRYERKVELPAWMTVSLPQSKQNGNGNVRNGVVTIAGGAATARLPL